MRIKIRIEQEEDGQTFLYEEQVEQPDDKNARMLGLMLGDALIAVSRWNGNGEDVPFEVLADAADRVGVEESGMNDGEFGPVAKAFSKSATALLEKIRGKQ